VEGEHMPGAHLVAVVPLGGITGGRPEIPVVGRRPGRVVVVVPGGGAGPGLVPAPAGVVAVGELGFAALVLGVVAGGEHGAGNPVQQPGGDRRTGRPAE